jgi:hypothetical protein
MQILDDFRAGRVETGPVWVLAEGERVEDCGPVKQTCVSNSFLEGLEYLHITRNSRISVDPPSSPDPSLPVEDTKLVEP